MRVDIDGMGWCDASTGAFEIRHHPPGAPFWGPTRAGLSTQLACSRVDGALLYVVTALLPRLEPDQRVRLAAALSSQAPLAVAFLTASSTGSCRLELATGEANDDVWDRLAMAAAVQQASWGWDESEQIVVTTPTRTIHVTPTYDGTHWSGRIVASA